jgi:hypothetical protein
MDGKEIPYSRQKKKDCCHVRRKDYQFHLLLLLLPGTSKAQSNTTWSCVTHGWNGKALVRGGRAVNKDVL